MAQDEKTKLRLEIAHVLFIDIVGYSKLSIDDQRRAIEGLNDAVQAAALFNKRSLQLVLPRFRRAMAWRSFSMTAWNRPWNVRWKSVASFRRRMHRACAWEFTADRLVAWWM